jgi:F420-non-reducing hydrogenase large subunit
MGPAAPAAKRNILGVVDTVGLEIGGQVLKNRSMAQKVQEIIGGKATHPVCGIPGGMSKPLAEEDRAKIEGWAKEIVEFAKFTVGLLDDVVLKNETYLNLIKDPSIYYHETYYMGMVDKNNKVNFYDGDIRVVDPSGKEFVKFKPDDYLEHLGEHTEPWSYEKFPFLKKNGWKGFVDGPESGMYRAAPLARINASSGFTTPLAQEQYERLIGFFKDLGVNGPIHHTLVYHWARVIELVHAAELLLECAQDPIITSKDIKNKPGVPGEGVGVLEAPRGTLYHHYVADENGIVQDVNLLVGTTNNNGPINMSINKAAKALIKNWQISPGILNQVEMAFRAYDPCNSCATHTLPGKMPIRAVVRRADGSVFQEIRNF